MLDDLKFIHQRDSQDALGIAERQWQQLEHKFDFDSSKLAGKKYDNVVYAGMGGSAWPADIAKRLLDFTLPFEICRNYHVPAYVSDKTLFISASYSGNTEETLAALAEAEERGATIAIIASGGKLIEIAQEKNYPLLKLPEVSQPRYSTMAFLKAIGEIIEASGLNHGNPCCEVLEAKADFVKQATAQWAAVVPQDKNPAKQLATELAGKSVVVYGGPRLSPAAYKWKISFNENAKNIAWWNEIPEFNHNEMIGWSSHPVDKPYAIVELRSDLEHPRVQKRFEVTDKLLSGRWPAPHVVEVVGEDLMEQLLWALAYGDFVSMYLALLNNVDPAPVDLVEKFKRDLG